MATAWTPQDIESDRNWLVGQGLGTRDAAGNFTYTGGQGGTFNTNGDLGNTITAAAAKGMGYGNDRLAAITGIDKSIVDKFTGEKAQDIDFQSQAMIAARDINPPGIISTARGNNPAGTPTGAAGVPGMGSPAQWNVTPDQTVEGRINNLTNPNNPIIQQARFRANAAMNDRGLVNSSIAATAADSAAYEAAIPIAQADAATAAKAASYNADQQNQFTLEGSRQAAQMDIARLNSDTQKQLSVMDNANREKAAAITASNNTLIQTNSQAASAFNQAMAAVNNITNNAQMDANAKTQATANVWASLISQLNVLGSVAGLNLTQTLNFAGQPGFNAQGQYVGFNPDGSTVGSTPPAPAPTPDTGGIVADAREQV